MTTKNNNQWNNNYCMSMLKTGNRKCMIRAKEGYDFCSKHLDKSIYSDDLLNVIKTRDVNSFKIDMQKLSQEINAQSTNKKTNEITNIIYDYYGYLNDNFSHNLFDLYDSWNDVSPIYHIIVHNSVWDVRMLINHISQQLNNSNLENPYPTYPNNPFTRIKFTPIELIQIKNKAIELKLSVNIAFNLLMKQSEQVLIRIMNDAMKNKNGFSSKLLILFDKFLRFRYVNCKNSQELYLGLWCAKTEPYNHFEKIYQILKEIPYQIYDHRMHMIIPNPQRKRYQEILDGLQEEPYDVQGDKYCVIMV